MENTTKSFNRGKQQFMKVQLVWAWFHEMPGSLIKGQQMSQSDDECHDGIFSG